MAKEHDFPVHCPACGEIGLASDMPRPGDFAVCSDCGVVSYFNKDLTLRRATTEELRKLAKRTGEGKA